MTKRMGMVGAAACAALVSMTAAARAADVAAPAGAPSLLLERATMLDAAAAAAPDNRTPFMRLINSKPLEDAGITISGRVEGSYTYGLGSPLGNAIAARTFDFEHEDLTLNQIGVYVERAVDGSKFDVGGRVEWIWGGDSRVIHSVGLFDHYGVGNGPRQPVGPEPGVRRRRHRRRVRRPGPASSTPPSGTRSSDPTGNDLYSHSFLFGYAIPFTHTGVLVKQKVNDQFDYTVGVIRGWDTSLEDNNRHAQLPRRDPHQDRGRVAGALADRHRRARPAGRQRQLADPGRPDLHPQARGRPQAGGSTATTPTRPTAHGSVSGSDAQWWGAAGYLVKQVDPHVAVVGRVEYFNDQDGARLSGFVGGTSLYEATLGLQVTPVPDDPYAKFLVIRPEIRLDYSDKRFFDGGTDRYQVTAAIDAVYKF